MVGKSQNSNSEEVDIPKKVFRFIPEQKLKIAYKILDIQKSLCLVFTTKCYQLPASFP